jgi:hypothetical protein
VSDAIRDEARMLREEGWTYRQLAELYGISGQHVRYLIDDEYAKRSRERSRAAKQRRKGVCRGCGGSTAAARYGGVSEYCNVCAPKHYGPIYAAERRGTGPLGQRLLEIVNPDLSFTDLAAQVGTSNNYMSVMINRMLHYGLIERVSRGRYRRVS